MWLMCIVIYKDNLIVPLKSIRPILLANPYNLCVTSSSLAQSSPPPYIGDLATTKLFSLLLRREMATKFLGGCHTTCKVLVNPKIYTSAPNKTKLSLSLSLSLSLGSRCHLSSFLLLPSQQQHLPIHHQPYHSTACVLRQLQL